MTECRGGCPQERDLFVFDFDNTIIEEDSDTCFYELFEGNKLPQELQDHFDENQLTASMNRVFTYLYENKISTKSLKSSIEKCHLVKGMRELFERIKQRGSEAIIISNANQFFIKWILDANSLESAFTAIYTNPAEITDNDRLILKRYHSFHNCPFCINTPNMCKSQIIEEHLNSHPERYNNIYYFGDGSNDFCPMMSLKNNACRGFVRSGFSLEKKIAKMNPDQKKFRCKLVYWNDATDFIDSL